MIRLTLLYAFVFGFAVHAWRNWFTSLCALIFLTAVSEHPDMPKAILGIPGLNPWNLLLLCVVTGWAASRGRERLRFDLPGGVALLLFLYLVIVLVAFVRMLADRSYIDYIPTKDLITDYFINTIKWAVPGLLLFDGARTPARKWLALVTIIGVYLAFAVQVIRWMPAASWHMEGRELEHLGLRLIHNEIGFSRVNMSMMLAGGAWAVLALAPCVRRRWRPLVYLGFLAVSYAQALTGGRMGYVTWGVLGLILGVVRWRRYLLLAPVVLFVVTWTVPAVRERMLEGIVSHEEEIAADAPVDDYQMTSGRTYIWPFVLKKIGERPVLGFGMLAMQRTGLAAQFRYEGFAHPHNAYLEVLLDSGVVGLVPILFFYIAVTVRALRLFVKPRDAIDSAIGGASCALVLALLVAGMGSQHFYPQVGGVGMWAAIGLMLRASVERAQARRAAREVLRARHLGRRRARPGPPEPNEPTPSSHPWHALAPPRRHDR